ncbi:SWIM zinc finger family protein [Allonocardiopsis opalescens]|uniref:Putative Zn finger protein n=1 Tax=Allonocardiopsis opalescens TaxID=1144618 RepID=A0A2T0PXM2_9ACTN|nr:SWIM zinc finger family protein [Allonocardiopsis opalescens]PRX96282.1 putative Zn finger protein [Allonocardiopsis opalescens]
MSPAKTRAVALRPPGPPTADDGAAKGAWWSRRLIELLEFGVDRGRLARGRDYAREGAVVELRVGGGELLARVQGGRSRPYQVSAIFRELAAADWERVAAALGSQPVFRAALAAGELPPEVEQVFRVLGLPLLPAGLADLVLTCSCPDWQAPCKHAAAVLYLFADALADDPFVLLEWLGRDRSWLLAELRRQARAAAEADQQARSAEPPLHRQLADFWSLRGPLPEIGEATADSDAAAGFPSRPASPLHAADPDLHIAGRPLAELLAPWYERLRDEPR